MWLSLDEGSLQLRDNVPAAFCRARGYRVDCVEGRLWLTITGQPGDFFLAAGEHLHIQSDGLALIEGCPAGTLRLVREADVPCRHYDRWFAAKLSGFRGKVARRCSAGILRAVGFPA